MIKAPAEEICGSGVSTSEKSMAAAVAAPQGSGAGMWHSPSLPSCLLHPQPAPCQPTTLTYIHRAALQQQLIFAIRVKFLVWHRAPPPASLPSLQCSSSQQLLPVWLKPAWKNELFSFFFEQGNGTNLSGMFQSPS